MELVIRTRDAAAAPGAPPVEVVERKGLGHPDTICDGVAEHVSVHLCRAYLERFGVILHHNVDKVLLVGGASRAAFGGGEVTEPIELYLAGRATAEHRGVRLPVHDIAVAACREWLAAHLRDLDVERHVRIVSRIRPGSSELTQVFARGRAAPLANDTSCGAGFAPLTDLERTVLAADRALADPAARRAQPELGEDVKVMGVRHGRRLHLTVGCAFVARHVRDLADYAAKREAARQRVLAAARAASPLEAEVTLNAADDLARGDVFLTVVGTSAEAGDDGEVGRGNRVSGLITPYRATTLEAAAGKNPVSHVGKLYNLAAGRIAAALVADPRAATADAACVMVSQIGRPIDDPQLVDVQLAPGPASAARDAAVAEVVRAQLARFGELREDLLAGRARVY